MKAEQIARARAANADRTVHAETGYAEVVRYDRAGTWYVEDRDTNHLKWRTRMSLAEVVEWLTDQPEGEVTVHFGKPGGRQFDSRLRYLDEFISQAADHGLSPAYAYQKDAG